MVSSPTRRNCYGGGGKNSKRTIFARKIRWPSFGASLASKFHPATRAKMNSNSFSLLSEIASTQTTGARLASFTYTAKGSGERARHTVALGISIENAYRRDLVVLKNKSKSIQHKTFELKKALEEKSNSEFRPVNLENELNSLEIEKQACQELIDSLTESLEKGVGNNSAYTCKDVYIPLCRGVKLQKENGQVHVTGFALSKVVLEPGEHKKVNSSPKTIAKDKLRKIMKSGKFRQFVLPALSVAKINGKTLEIDEPAPVEPPKPARVQRAQNIPGVFRTIDLDDEEDPRASLNDFGDSDTK